MKLRMLVAFWGLLAGSVNSALIGGSTSEPLGSYNVDSGKISVSGLSAGGFFAVQLHVAYSDVFMGAGIMAAGPYYCAQNSVATSLNACMSSPEQINLSELTGFTNTAYANGDIANPGNLKSSRVFIFSGNLDSVVDPGVVQNTEQYYNYYGANVETEYSIAGEHGFPTMNHGATCSRKNRDNYINDCDYPGAYHVLNHIYSGVGSLAEPNWSDTTPPQGTMYQFDQTEFLPNAASYGVNEYGYLFVPTNCESGNKACRLHVALHGCLQGVGEIGEDYINLTGYQGVAALNDIIVLFPQGKAIPISNPNNCWDWWGYNNSEYPFTNGIQADTVMQMVDRVSSGGGLFGRK